MKRENKRYILHGTKRGEKHQDLVPGWKALARSKNKTCSTTAWARSELVLPLEGHLRRGWHLLVGVHSIRINLRLRHERRLELAADEIVGGVVVELEKSVRPDLILTSRA